MNSKEYDFKDTAEKEEGITSDLRRLFGVYRLVHTFRYKDDTQTKESPEKNIISVSDTIMIQFLLLHYFLEDIENNKEDSDYKKLTEMLLSTFIAGIPAPFHPVTNRESSYPFDDVVNNFLNLPIRNEFNTKIINNYAQYLENSSEEAKVVRAIGSFQYMMNLVVFSNDKDGSLENELEQIGDTTLESLLHNTHHIDGMKKFSEILYRLLKRRLSKKSNANDGLYSKTPNPPTNIIQLITNNDSEYKQLTIREENERLAKFCKRKKLAFRRGQITEDDNMSVSDSVAQHTAHMLLLAYYFFPENQSFSLREIHEIILAHDASEALTGDKIGFQKKQEDRIEEQKATELISSDYAPKQHNISKRYIEIMNSYENIIQDVRNGAKPTSNQELFVKAIDGIEAFLHLYDRSTREILSAGKGYKWRQKQEEFKRGYEKFFTPFKTLLLHYEDLIKKFEEEKLF